VAAAQSPRKTRKLWHKRQAEKCRLFEYSYLVGIPSTKHYAPCTNKILSLPQKSCMSETQLQNELDEIGAETLDVVGQAQRFNRWMFETIKPHCAGHVLEVGSGVGNMSKFFMEAGMPIMLTELRTHYCNKLGELYNGDPSLLGIRQMDLTDPAFETKFADLLGKFDTVFALNVVEHIEDHDLALLNIKKLLKTGGKLIVLVPAFQALYNKFDTELGHFRRYTRTNLGELFKRTQYDIKHQQYFNAAGMPGWFVSGKLQGNKSIPSGQMALYDKLVPVFKVGDLFLNRLMGLSTITVGAKP
jgi:SAM-dependent methyltransferase